MKTQNRIYSAATVAVALCGLATPAARAADKTTSPASVTSMNIEMPSMSGDFTSTLSLKFTTPITQKDAETIRTEVQHGAAPKVQLTGRGPGNNSASKAYSISGRPAVAYLSCDGSGVWTDGDGTWSLNYTCMNPNYSLAWGYVLNATVQRAVVGSVSEQGIQWWVNNVRQKKWDGAPHVEGAGYHFHGSFKYGKPGNEVKYWDYYSFRHNIGPGGTASIVVTGKVHLLAD